MKRNYWFMIVLIVLALLLANCVPPPVEEPLPPEPQTPEEPITADPLCADFEDLSLGTVYVTGDVIVTNGIRINATDFQWGTGNWTNTGFTEVGNAGNAGGSGQELIVNNILLKFELPGSYSALELNFGEYGGNLNIDINNDFVNFDNFADINGAVIGGTNITVVNGMGNDMGTLTVAGSIEEFAIGGQELFIDNVCLRE